MAKYKKFSVLYYFKNYDFVQLDLLKHAKTVSNDPAAFLSTRFRVREYFLDVKHCIHFEEYGKVADVPRGGVRGARYPEVPQVQGSDMRHAFVEGEARVGHGQDQDTAIGEGSGGARDKTTPSQVSLRLRLNVRVSGEKKRDSRHFLVLSLSLFAVKRR